MTAAAICQALLMARTDLDPYWAYVKTLLHFDGGLTDSSTAGVLYSNTLGAVIDASNQLYGSGCLDTRADSDARCGASSSALALSTVDFCVEFWYRDTVEVENNTYFFLYEGSTSQTVRLYIPSASDILADASGGGPAGPGVSFTVNTWNHAAVTRSGNNWTQWHNGVAVKTWVNATFNGGTGTASVWFGSGSSLGTGFTGFIDEARITIGVPRYTTTFTPSGPFPNQ